jgi:hypothetical protein
MSNIQFRKKLEHLINCESMENGSNTPDFILAEYLVRCLATFDAVVTDRERWCGRGPVAVDAPDDAAKP